MNQFKGLISKVADGVTLTREESALAFAHIASGEATSAQMGAMLMALRIRGETVDEITGAAITLRGMMASVALPAGPALSVEAMDVVGTGGDASGSVNISTCAAFIVAGAGVPVAKHGNRALSSRCGSADVLAALGVGVNLTPELVARCVAEAGIGFMFAPAFHLALKHVAPVRVELGTRTIFNLLGPLLNPAGVRRHLVGVYARQWAEPLARVLGELGSERAFVVHGSDGLDELTLTGPTTVAALDDGAVRVLTLAPEDAGLSRVTPAELKGGDAAHNAEALLAVLRGEKGAFRDVGLLNASAALMIAGLAADLKEGVDIAARSIDSGAAAACLDRLIAVSNQ